MDRILMSIETLGLSAAVETLQPKTVAFDTTPKSASGLLKSGKPTESKPDKTNSSHNETVKIRIDINNDIQSEISFDESLSDTNEAFMPYERQLDERSISAKGSFKGMPGNSSGTEYGLKLGDMPSQEVERPLNPSTTKSLGGIKSPASRMLSPTKKYLSNSHIESVKDKLKRSPPYNPRAIVNNQIPFKVNEAGKMIPS